MNSLSYATSYATATNALGWPSTIPTSGHANTLPRTLINKSSPVDLVEAFTMNTDPKGLALYILQSLTSDAVTTLQSLQHSNITRYLTVFEEVLSSYAVSLGKTCCVTRLNDGHESPCSQGSPLENIPPPAGTMGPRTKDQYTIGGQYQPCNMSCGLGNIPLSSPSCRLLVADDGGTRSNHSSEPVTPQNTHPVTQHYHGCLSSAEDSEPSHQCSHYRSVSQQVSGSPGINATGSLQEIETCRSISLLPTLEPSNQGMLLPTVPLPAVPISSPDVLSPFNIDRHSSRGMSTIAPSINSPTEFCIGTDIPRQLRPSPPWLTAPSPSLLPTPSFLIRDQSPSSLALRVQNTSFLLDDDDLTWKGLEKAITDARRSQAESDDQHTGEAAQDSEPSYSDSSLGNGPSSSLSAKAPPIVFESKGSATFKHQLFRPFSISPSGSAVAAHLPNLAPSVNVSDFEPSNRSCSRGSNYICSDASGYCRSSFVWPGDPSHDSSKPGVGSLGPAPETSLPSPGDSTVSSQPFYSTAVFMDDDARRHILAPRPIRAGVGPSFLDSPPPPQLSPDILDCLSLQTVGDVCNEITPMLCNPTRQNILIFVEAVFDHVVSTDDADAVIELLSFIFRFWGDGHLVSSGLATAAAMEWIEFTSHNLVTRIRQEFRKIANMTGVSFPAKVAPIFKFILYLQELPSVARKAQQSLRALVDAILDSPEKTLRSACLVARRVNFLVSYFSPSMKGEITGSWVSSWHTVRSAALSFLHGKLRSFVSLFIDSSAREIQEPKSVLFLGNFFSRLTSKKMLSKVLPVKKLVALLKPPDRATLTTKRSNVKAAVTFLLTVCSNSLNQGCIVCSKHDAQGSTRRKERACACTAYLDLLNYDLDAAKSLIGRGLLRDGLKALLEMDVIEAHVNEFPREQ